jgi:dipeptidyl-peptidase-4
MIKNQLFIFMLLVSVFSSEISLAQPKTLNLEDIYKNNIYGYAGYGPVRWMKDNKSYSTLERNEKTGGRDIVSYEAASGARKVLVNASQLIPSGNEKPLGISDYIWSDDNSRLLIFTNTKKVWRYNTKGDYWVLNLVSGKLSQLGKNLERSSLMFAKFSPDGGRAAYVSKQNIYAEDIE